MVSAPETLVERYADEIRTALTIRKTEERLLELFQQGQLFGTVHTCIGQEFSGVAVARVLKPQDTVFSNHRCHGHFLACCRDLLGLIGEVMGREVGVCGGRGGSQHLHSDNFYSNGIQGGIVPVAVGLGAGHRFRGTGGVSVVFIGDGTLGEGVLYEAMNLAAKWSLPVLFVCENNIYAQSTHQSQTLAGDIAARAAAFGIETMQGDTWDWEQLFSYAETSIEQVRQELKPVFLQIDTYRLMAHSKGDDDRSDAEVEPYRAKDPINRLLVEFGLDLAGPSEKIASEIDQAVAQASASPFASLGQDTDMPAPIQWIPCDYSRERVVDSVRRGLGEGLAMDERVFLLGEDIESPYGGAFKCTLGLSERFPGRVRNTPISEAAIVGMGNGLALSGLVPVVEIMFGDFLTLATDQWINHAAKFSWMYNDKVHVPLIIRTPMGGKRGYAATHSQSLEKHFLGLPGTRVLALNHRYPPAALYADLFREIDRPTLVIENKTLYGQYVDGEAPDGFGLRSDGGLFPVVNLYPRVPADLTIIALGGISPETEKAALVLFEEYEVVADLYFPTQLYPFDLTPILPSLEMTGRLLVVEEGQGFASLSSEILAQVAERGEPVVSCARSTAYPSPIPASRPMEDQCLPGAAAIVEKAMGLVDGQ